MATIAHRCWIHPAREAVCRCPACARSFCRECVTGHDGRLLCAACLGALGRKKAQRNRWRRLLDPAAVAAGVLITWLTFYSAGQVIYELNARVGEQRWQAR